MRGKKWTSRVLCVCLCALFFFGAPPAARQVQGASLAELEQQLNDLKAQQKKLDAQLAQTKNDKQRQAEYRDSLTEKIANAQSQIDVLDSQIRSLDSQISEKSQAISSTEGKIGENFDQLKKRLRVLYMTGEASALDILFSADNVMDFLNRAEFVRAITEHDAALIDSLKEDQAAIQAEKESIEANRTKLAQSKVEYDQQKAQLKAAIAESDRITASLSQSEQTIMKNQKEINAAFDRVDKQIEQWWINYYKEQEENDKPISTGSFMWPMPGYSRKSNITQYFGGVNNHRGMDISGAGIYGKTIVAADSGRVAYTSTNDPVYGIYLTIDHGNNIATLYGHTSKLLVKAGQTVKKGDPIALVGSSGMSSGAHLHFGVLIGGKPVDPLKYFTLK